MITIHEATASDFSTLGLGALMPSECIVEEKGGGLYELTLVQPFTADLRHELLKCARIIKAPAPVRETPLLTINATQAETITRDIYRVQTDGRRLNLRVGPGMDYKTVNAYKPGTEVVYLETNGDWARIISIDGGETGWMFRHNLTYVRRDTETISKDSPGTIIQPRQTRDQLFRIYEIDPDTKLRTVTARAQHITYDLKGAVVVGEYAPENVAANTVCAQLIAKADHDISDFNIYCGVTDKISGDYTDRNLLDCLLDPETGVVAQTHARVVRDNYDIFILPGEGRERGVELRYGKNLLSASMPTGTADLITRIRPVGKDGEGNPLYITKNNGFVDSPRINDYPVIYAKRVEYDVLVGKDMTEEQARAELEKRAKAEFDGGCDLPSISVDADFVRLDLTEEYKELASAYALHLYDLVPVIDKSAGIIAKVRMTGYKYDAVLDRYESTELGDIAEAEVSVYGYELAGGSISGGKIVPNSMSGDRIRNLSIGYAKMDVAAIRQLSADAITAVRADIRKLVAQEITTDQLYADLAVIAAAQITAANIERANIQWADIDSLTAEIANIVNAEIGTADIDYARIKDMVTDTAIITEGVGGQLYINRLAVTEANMVQLTVGALMLKAADGSFVRLLADGKGGVKTETVQVEGDNVANATIPGGKLIENTITARELNVSQIFADKALIRAIKAANIDVADLFAASATITALDNYILRTSTIQAIEGKLDVWAAKKIDLAVDEIRPGGRNLIRNTKRLTKGSTIDTWSNSSGTWFYDNASGFARGQFSTSGYTSDTWSWVQSPLVELPSGWQGRQVTFSTYIWSENWAAVDNGISISLCLSTGKKSRTNYGSVRAVLYNGGSPVYGSGVNAEHPLSNGKWLRISMTFTLDKTGLTGNPSNDLNANTHMFITYWLVRNGGYRFYAPKLEWGNKATDWSPHPEEFEAGTNVLITKDQFKVKTHEFSVDIPTEDGTETMLRIDKEGVYTPHLESPNVAPRYDGPGTLYVNPNATSAQIAAGNYFRSMADAFAVLSEKQIAYSVTINLAAGMTEYGNVRLRGVSGPYWVYINGNSSNRANLVGQLDLSYNKCMVRVQYLNVNSAVNTRSIFVGGGASMAIIQHCTVTGKGVSGTVGGKTNTGSVGIYAELGSNVQVTGCELYDTYRSLYVQTLGQMQSISNKGNCTIGTNRSHVFIEGTAPCESTTWTVSKVGGGQAWVASNVTVDQGSKPSAPAVTTKTVSYKANNSDVYAGGGWNNYSAEDIYQGYTTALGEHRGCFWFDNATIRSALNGKTIKQATLTLYQMSGVGRNQPVQVNLEGITATSGTGSSPVGKPEYGVIGTTLGVNQATTFTLPTAVITDLVKGTINGLMLRTGETSVMKNDDNSYNYARFAGKATAANAPVLTVTYVK